MKEKGYQRYSNVKSEWGFFYQKEVFKRDDNMDVAVCRN